MPETPPLLAFTVACGDEARAQAEGCEASFRHFHPDIPFLRIGEEEYQFLAGGNPPAWPGEVVSMRSLAGWFLSRHVTRLIYLDSDLWVLGRLDGLMDDSIPTAWTRDCAAYTMGVPDCPRLNSGVLASSDPMFWPLWTAPQYGCLVPALPKFYLNQLALRLMVKASAVRGRIIDGPAGAPFYNVSINEQPGEWHIENGAAFKGVERALIYHQAGEETRGIDAAPAAAAAVPARDQRPAGSDTGARFCRAVAKGRRGLHEAPHRIDPPLADDDPQHRARGAVCENARLLPLGGAGGLGPLSPDQGHALAALLEHGMAVVYLQAIR